MQLPKFLCCLIIFPFHIKEIEVTKITASVIVPYHLFWKKKNMINNWNFCCWHSPTNCPVSLKIVLFKENLRKLQPCLGNWLLGSRNAGNSVSECAISKMSWGACPQTPLGSLRLWCSQGGLQHQKHLASGTLRNMSTTLKNCWKPS